MILQMKTTVFTICSANYLPYARVLHRSLARNGAVGDFVCFLVDEINGRFSTCELPFDCVEARTIGCGNFFDMAARYSIMEMNTAIKPYCFKWLLENKKSNNIVYLDPDIYVLAEFVELYELLSADADIVLTPHSTKPLRDGKDPDDLRLLRTGAYNLGFCAVRPSSSASAFLDWWHGHLIENCTIEIEKGVFVDQKYCDLVPSYFDNVRVLRHPGYNVAYWNLLHRKVSKDRETGMWQVNALPLRFFHFSGVVPGDDTIFSKHQNRFSVHNIGDVKELLTNYVCELRQLSRLSDTDLFSLRYSYANLPGDIPFTEDLRTVYRELLRPDQRSVDAAFSTDFGRYLTLSPDVMQDESAPITRLAYAIWKSRRDLKEMFALGSCEGRAAFLSWFFTTATREHKVSPLIVNATQELTYPDLTIANNRVRGVRYDGTTSSDRYNLAAYLDWAAPRRIHPDIAIGLSLFGYFRSENGLGAAVRANFQAAQSVGINVTAHDVPSVGFERRVDPNFPISEDPPPYDCLLLHVNADQVSKLETYIDPRRLRGRHRIGYWAWELGAMPLEWVGAYKCVDEIWAPSQFAANAFKQRTTKPVSVVHHPVEVPSPRKDTDILRAKFGLPTDRVVFLTAFDLNSYIDRKNPDGAIDAFKNAFVENDTEGPVLAIKFHGNYHRNSRFERFLETVSFDSRIILLDKVLTVQEISELQWCCDAFISLHRSEGFGLWIAECMARGKPCIVTNYSGNVDFTDATNSIPIGYSMVRVRTGEYPFGEGQWWAEPDMDEAVSALRDVADSAIIRGRIGSAARHYVAKHLSFPLIGSVIKERLFAGRSEIIDLPELLVTS
jgi:glycosyltransferase involved in cell wall biosynthesis